MFNIFLAREMQIKTTFEISPQSKGRMAKMRKARKKETTNADVDMGKEKW